MKIPVNTVARISFPEPIPVNGTIPIALTIPVDIPLSDTGLAGYLKKLAYELRRLADLSQE